MVRIALDVNHLRNRVLGLVAQRVNDHAATHRTIRTSAARLGGTGNLQAHGLGVSGSEIESKKRKARASGERSLQEGPAREFHFTSSGHFGRGPKVVLRKAERL